MPTPRSTSRPPARLLSRLGLALALGVAPAPAALAATPRQEKAAVDQANKGIKLLQEGRWEEAITELGAALEQAVEIGSVPLIASCHRAIAKAHDALGHVDVALRHYRAYLDANLDEALRRKEVEDRIAALEAMTRAELAVTVDVDGAAVTIDGEPVAITHPMKLPAGTYRLRVEAPGHLPHEESVTLAGGQKLQLVVHMRPGRGAPTLPGEAPPPAEPVDFGPWPWVAIGVGAVGVGLGTWLVLDGQADWDAVEEARDDDPPTMTRGQADALVADGDSKRTAGFATLGVGSGLAITGLVLLLLEDDAPQTATTFHPLVGPGLTGLGLATHF